MSQRKILLLSFLAVLIPVLLITWRVLAQENRLAFDNPVTAAIDAGEIQRWNFEGYNEDVISISLTRTEGNFSPTLRVFDANGDLQAQTQGHDTETQLTLRLSQRADYVLEVESAESGEYRLLLSLEAAGRREFEQGTLAFGEIIRQEISDDIPYHTWEFTGRAGQVIDLNMQMISGDLSPALSLISPLNTTLAADDALGQSDEASILAYRLPLDGVYIVTAARTGELAGIGGDTTGTYQIQLTLRNGEDATASALLPNQRVEGRLTADSPIARYSIIAGGTHVALVELSEPGCLVDFAVLENGTRLENHFIGLSPFAQAVDLTPPGRTQIFEVAAQHCTKTEAIDFNFTLLPLDVEMPLQYLPPQQQVAGQPGAENRWFFLGQAGDMVRLSLENPAPDQSLPIEIRDSQNQVIYTADFYRILDETLTLPATGIYTIEIGVAQLPYRLKRELVGSGSRLFTQVAPAWQQFLDISTPESWSIKVETEQPSVLIVENPAGEQIAVAATQPLSPPRLAQIEFAEQGRYTVKVLSNEPPANVSLERQLDNQLQVNATTKGILSANGDFHIWKLPLRAGDILNLKLTTLTEGATAPAISLLNPQGIKIEPRFTTFNGGSTELIDYAIADSGVYQVLVTAANENSVTYAVQTDVFNGVPETAFSDFNLSSPAPEFFAAAVVPTLDTYLAPPFPSSDLDLYESARQLVPPETGRGEIAPGQRREVWRLNVLQAQMLAITVTSVDGQPAPGITLLDATRNLLSEHWERESGTNQLLYRVPQSNTYYVGITGSETGGRYIIHVENLFDIDETAPAVVDTAPIDIGMPRLGEFLAQDEVDRYTFWGLQGETLQITAHLQAGNLVPDLTLLSPADTEISGFPYDVAAGQAQSELITLPDDGFYTVVATAVREGRQDEYSQYTVLINRLTGEQRETGWLINEVFGFVGFNQPRDNWYIYGQAGEEITLHADPLAANGPSPLTVYLADTGGNIFFQQSTQLNINRLTIEDIMLPQTGIYQVSVDGGETGVGNYRLSIERDQTYLRPGDHAIVYGDTGAGVFTAGNIFDRWIFAGNQGDVIAIALRPVRGSLPTMTGFQLEDAAHVPLQNAIDTGTGAGARLANITLPATGIYSILVSSLDEGFTGAGVYELSLELQNRTLSHTAGTLIPYDSIYQSALYADDPLDVWLFEGQQDDVITVSVSGDGVLIPLLNLFNADPTVAEGQPQPLLARTGTTSEAAQLVQYRLPAAGAYGIVVSGVSGTTGNYTLQIQANAQVDIAAAPLLAGTPATSRLERGDVQRWQFTGNTGDLISLIVAPLRNTGLAPTFALFAPDNTLLNQQISVPGTDIVLAEYRLPASGVYTAVIGTVLGDEGITNGQYTLTLSQTPAAAPQIVPVEEEGTGLGTLSSNNSDDLWSFTGQAGNVFRIRVQRTSGNLDPVIRLWQPDGQLIAQSDDSGNSLDAELVIPLIQDGTYTVEVSRFGDELGITEGNYRLEALSIYQNAASPISSERYLTYGQRVVATLDPLVAPETPNSHIWYFLGNKGDRISASIQFPGDDRPLTLFLADGAGNRYQQAERVNDQSLLNDFELPANGIYSLIVQRSQDSRVEEFHPYSLALELNAAQDTLSEGGFIQLGGSVTGRLTLSSQTHQWLYNGRAGEALSIGLVTLESTSYPDLLLLSPNRDILLNLPGTGSTDNVSINLPTDGLYQIIVINKSLAPLLNYRLVVNPGGQATIAGVLAFDQPYSGILTDSSAEQVWMIEGSAGTPLFARAALLTGNVILSMRLETVDGQVLSTSQVDPLTGHFLLPGVVLPSDGEYRLRVRQSNPAPASYVLRISQNVIPSQVLLAQALLPGLPANGSVDGVQNAYYSFWGDPHVAASVGIDVLDGSGSPTLRVLDKQGRVIQSQVNRLENLLLPKADLYLLEVTNENPMYFEIHFVARPGTPQAGTDVREIRRDVNLQGVISPATPDALWTFSAEAGETLTFEIDTIGNTLELDLILYSPSGYPVLTHVQPEGLNNLVLGPVFMGETGVYTLRIGTWLGVVPNAQTRYNMRVTAVSPVDDPGSQGGNLTTFDQPVFGGLNAADSQDIWTFTADGASNYTLSLDRLLGDAGLSLTLTSPDGTPLDISSYLIEEADIWAIQNLPLKEEGLYTLTIAANQAGTAPVTAYRLAVSPEKIINLDQVQAIALNEVQNGELSSHADLWRFQATAAASITITTDNPLLDVSLLNPDGELLYTGKGQISQALLPAEGLYAIQVSSADGYQGAYSLQVQVDTPRAYQREELPLNTSDIATFSPDFPVHEWVLSNYIDEAYSLSVAPVSPHWQPQVFLVDAVNQLMATGEPQSDGSVRIETTLAPNTQYSVLITAPDISETYVISFAEDIVQISPAPISPDEIVKGYLNADNQIDEWLFDGSLAQVIQMRAIGSVTVRLFAPGNYLLQEVASANTGSATGEPILLPIEGIYIVQVIPAAGQDEVRYELQVVIVPE